MGMILTKAISKAIDQSTAPAIIDEVAEEEPGLKVDAKTIGTPFW